MPDAGSGGRYWLASYPKSGNTWFRSFLTNLHADCAAPVSINALTVASISSSRRQWFDAVLGFDTADFTHDEIDRLRPIVYGWMDDPGKTVFIKVHDAYGRMPDGTPLFAGPAIRGALYCVRNPLDVAISYAHHSNIDISTAIAWMGDEAHALSRQRRRLLPQLRQHVGSWSSHVVSWADAEALPCHVVRYEDMLGEPMATFARAAQFLGMASDPQRIARAVRFSGFEVLRRQEEEADFIERPAAMPRFFRSGKIGGWRDRLSDVQIAQIVAQHGPVMHRFGYLDANENPL